VDAWLSLTERDERERACLRSLLLLLDDWVDVLDDGDASEFLCTGRDLLGATSSTLCLRAQGERSTGVAWATGASTRARDVASSTQPNTREGRLLDALDSVLDEWRAVPIDGRSRIILDGTLLLDGSRAVLASMDKVEVAQAREWADRMRERSLERLSGLLPSVLPDAIEVRDVVQNLDAVARSPGTLPDGLSRYLAPLADTRGARRVHLPTILSLVSIARVFVLENHEWLCLTVTLLNALHADVPNLLVLAPFDQLIERDRASRVAMVRAKMSLDITKRVADAIECMPDDRRQDAFSIVRKLLTKVGLADEAGDAIRGARQHKALRAAWERDDDARERFRRLNAGPACAAGLRGIDVDHTKCRELDLLDSRRALAGSSQRAFIGTLVSFMTNDRGARCASHGSRILWTPELAPVRVMIPCFCVEARAQAEAPAARLPT
jgi:hypothetical protein